MQDLCGTTSAGAENGTDLWADCQDLGTNSLTTTGINIQESVGLQLLRTYSLKRVSGYKPAKLCV